MVSSFSHYVLLTQIPNHKLFDVWTGTKRRFNITRLHVKSLISHLWQNGEQKIDVQNMYMHFTANKQDPAQKIGFKHFQVHSL